jgi:phage terminase large subunit
MEISPQEALAILEGYSKRPVEFCDDVLGANFYDMQNAVIDSIFKNRETAVKSCNAVGKSYLAARAALAFLTLKPGSTVVTTAPTKRQVEDVIWRELATAHKKAKFPLGGSIRKTGLEFAPDWFAVGFTTKTPERFFGYHADDILVIIDEASGMEEPIYKGVRAITPNENARTLYIGNPTNADGTFAAAFKNPRVKKFTISAFDSPNLKANNITNVQDLIKIFTPPDGVDPLDHKPKFELPKPELISPTAVFERYQEWGVNNPFWQSLIMGEFPDDPEDSLIPMRLVQIAMNKEWREENEWTVEDGVWAYGVDVARYGSDRTVIVPRHGGFVEKLKAYTKQDTALTTDRIIEAMQVDGRTDDAAMTIRVDDSTMGGGVTDQLVRRKRDNQRYHYKVMPILFNHKPNNPTKFYDRRAEMYWTVRQRFFDHNIALPDDPELAAELASVKYEILRDGRIRIEQKDEIKARTGKSPDKADALVLAFAPGGGTWEQAPFTQASSGREPAKTNTLAGNLLDSSF